MPRWILGTRLPHRFNMLILALRISKLGINCKVYRKNIKGTRNMSTHYIASRVNTYKIPTKIQ